MSQRADRPGRAREQILGLMERLKRVAGIPMRCGKRELTRLLNRAPAA